MTKEMTKQDLMELVERQQNEIMALKASRKRGSGRKLELLEVMAEHGSGKILDIANLMKVSSKNVSSLKCYLKKDGWGIINNEDGEMQITKHKGEMVDADYIRSYVAKEREVMAVNVKTEE